MKIQRRFIRRGLCEPQFLSGTAALEDEGQKRRSRARVLALTGNLINLAAHGVRGSGVPPQNAFHLIFQVQLTLLEGDFFELFWFREVMAGGAGMYPFLRRG